MKIRWRQQEMIFASAVVAILCIRMIVEQLSSEQLPLHSTRESFILNGQPFSLFFNYILPGIAPFVTLLIVIVALNMWLVPLLQKSFRIVAVLVFCVLSYIGLSAVLAFSYWLEGAYLLKQITETELQQAAIRYALKLGLLISLPITLYIIFRELIIQYLEKTRNNNEYAALLCNKITGAAFLYAGGFIFFAAFELLRSDVAGIFYTFYLGPLILNCFINIYVLFPRMYRNQYRFKNFGWRFLITPLLLAFLGFLIFIGATNNANWILPATIFLFVLVIGFPISWILYQQQREKLESVTQLKKDLVKTTVNLQHLQSQINPHFLFNILNSIYGTALRENAATTADAIQRLGDMMRFMMDENNLDFIPLDKEIDYLKQYLFLQQTRLQETDPVSISTQFPEQSCPNTVAPMLLIPFVENAFKHGIRQERKSWIHIRISCNPESLLFEVNNSLHPKPENDPEKDRNGIGLKYVRERLQLVYPGKHELILHETSDEYLVRLKLSFD